MCRSHGNISFHLTQTLTGHGVFYSYLKRIKKSTTNRDRCPHCNTGKIDTVEHTLLECREWCSDRKMLLAKTKLATNTFTIRMMAKAMVVSREGWRAVQTFVEKVMFEKEEFERSLERKAYDNDNVTDTD